MGTYCPPLAVFIDNAFLASLEQRHLSNGSAEILKMACIKDAALFELLEKHAAELLRTNFQVGHHLCKTLLHKYQPSSLCSLPLMSWQGSSSGRVFHRAADVALCILASDLSTVLSLPDGAWACAHVCGL